MLISGVLLDHPDDRPERGWLRLADGVITDRGLGAAPAEPDLDAGDALVTPGFIDAHLHLPQIDAIGCDAGDLLHWLDAIIFPAESAWADPAVARAQCDRGLARLLRAGTLGCCAFLTAHPHGLESLRQALDAVPLRAIAGQALMNRAAPAALTEHAPASLPPDTPRTAWSINPRFAVSCDDALLKHAATLAAPDRLVHTHLAEQRAECTRVSELFPDALDYVDVYDRAGLLGPRTLLAHAIHLSEREWSVIAERGAAVVHCPGANTFLESGLFDLAAARRHGVPVALGSDVAAGPDVAMPRVARAMIEVAKLRRLTIDPEAIVPTPEAAWHMITRGNAEILGWRDAGHLERGAAADLLVIDPPAQHADHLIGRLLHDWHDERIRHRIVHGRLR